MMKKIFNKTVICVLLCTMMFTLAGCAMFGSKIHSLKGSITGNTYLCEFYSNKGEKFMTLQGEQIDIEPNIVEERVYTDSGWGIVKTLSSVLSITVDGHQVESCGSTVLFIENGLNPDVEFNTQECLDIVSEAEDFSDYTYIANIVNKVKNKFGKPVVVIIQSQLGDPICVFSGNEVYWEVCNDLPKTTKLYIDNKALYIHRANFQLVDTSLIVDETEN